MNSSYIDSLARAMDIIDEVLSVSFDEMSDDEWHELYEAMKPFEDYCMDKGIIS